MSSNTGLLRLKAMLLLLFLTSKGDQMFMLIGITIAKSIIALAITIVYNPLLFEASLCVY